MARKRRMTNSSRNSQNKRKKPNECPDASKVSESIKIIDINMDCLEHILKRLSIDDLLNVADSNKRMREAAAFTLAFKYKILWLTIKNIRISSQSKIICFHRGRFSISNVRTCLRFLRCFGNMTGLLYIYYNGADDEHCAVIDQYLNKYCAETLSIIQMNHARKNTMNRIQKPFTKVFFLTLRDCVLGRTLANVGTWFPHTCALSLDGFTKIAPRTRIPINSLSHFFIFNVNLNNRQHRNNLKPYMLNILNPRPFPNLTLELRGIGWDLKFLRRISNHLQNITALDIEWTNNFSNLSKRNKNLQTIHFERVNDLRIDCTQLKSGTEMPRIPFSSDELIKISICSMHKMNEDFFKFIKKQPLLKMFCVHSSKYDNVWNAIVERTKLTQALCKLHEIKLPFIFTIDEVNQFLNECKSMQKFEFKLAETENFQMLAQRLANKWEIINNLSRNVVLKRQ